MGRITILAVFSIIIGFGVCHAATDKIFCYSGNGRFTVEDINSEVCTHIIFTFIGFEPSGLVRILDPWNEITNHAFTRFSALKNSGKKPKVLVAVGGWNQGSAVYSQVPASPTLRQAMADSVVGFLEEYNFDGFVLDWQYPAKRGGVADDKPNLIHLLKLFRQRFDQSRHVLTVSVAASDGYIVDSYDVLLLHTSAFYTKSKGNLASAKSGED